MFVDGVAVLEVDTSGKSGLELSEFDVEELLGVAFLFLPGLCDAVEGAVFGETDSTDSTDSLESFTERALTELTEEPSSEDGSGLSFVKLNILSNRSIFLDQGFSVPRCSNLFPLAAREPLYFLG